MIQMISEMLAKYIRLATYPSLAAIVALSFNSSADSATAGIAQEAVLGATDTSEYAIGQPTDLATSARQEPILVAEAAPAAPTPVVVAEAPQVDPYAKYSQYLIKGWNINQPDPSNFIDQDPYGIRTKMAEDGLFLYGFSNNTYTYDVRNDDKLYGTAQVYSGQKSTYSSINLAFLTYDLGKIGLPGGQFAATLTYAYFNWAPQGPTHAHLGDLKYYQTFLDGKVELTIGYLGNTVVYNGTYIGGNLAGGTFGVNASIPQEAGQTQDLVTRPAINLKLNLGNGFYNLAGIQRSWNPGGTQAEINANGFGFGWNGRGIGELFQEEFGYQRAAAPDRPFTWVRAGYAYNNSDYASLKTPGTTSSNHYYSVLGDRQLLQLGDTAGSAYRGLYGGFTVMEAPPEVDRFSQYYELRLYMKGPLDSRPTDTVSFVVDQNRFSKYAIAIAEAQDQLTVDQATSVSLGYTANVIPGVFITSGFSYIDHPRPVTTIPEQKSAVNFLFNVLFYW